MKPHPFLISYHVCFDETKLAEPLDALPSHWFANVGESQTVAHLTQRQIINPLGETPRKGGRTQRIKYI